MYNMRKGIQQQRTQRNDKKRIPREVPTQRTNTRNNTRNMQTTIQTTTTPSKNNRNRPRKTTKPNKKTTKIPNKPKLVKKRRRSEMEYIDELNEIANERYGRLYCDLCEGRKLSVRILAKTGYLEKIRKRGE